MALSIFGGLVTASGFLLILPARSFASGSLKPLWCSIGTFALIAIGFQIGSNAESVLKDGVRNNRWEAIKTESLLRKLESLPMKVFTVGLIVAMITLLFVSFLHFPHTTQSPAFALAFIPMMIVGSLGRVIGALKGSPPDIPQDNTRTFAPIHSDQWGHR